MLTFLAAVFVLAVAELWAFMQVAHLVGVLYAVLLLVVVSFLGLWLVKRAGTGVYRRVRRELQRGTVPADELLDGLVVLTAGVLLFLPGYITAVAGLLLLAPPLRRVARRLVVRWLPMGAGTGAVWVNGRRWRRSDPLDTQGWENPEPRRRPPVGALTAARPHTEPQDDGRTS